MTETPAQPLLSEQQDDQPKQPEFNRIDIPMAQIPPPPSQQKEQPPVMDTIAIPQYQPLVQPDVLGSDVPIYTEPKVEREPEKPKPKPADK